MTSLQVFNLRMVKEREIPYNLEEARMNNPSRVHEILDEVFEMGSLCEEVLVLICLDTKNKPIGLFKVSQGTLNASMVHPREVFKRAILCNANSIILAHNHPSGDKTPSDEDKTITYRIQESGNLLGIRLLDHVIIAGTDIYSMKQEGVI